MFKSISAIAQRKVWVDNKEREGNLLSRPSPGEETKDVAQ